MTDSTKTNTGEEKKTIIINENLTERLNWLKTQWTSHFKYGIKSLLALANQRSVLTENLWNSKFTCNQPITHWLTVNLLMLINTCSRV